MINLIGFLVIMAIAVVMITIGASTLRFIGDEVVPSLSRTSQRLVSRQSEPVGFWLTMATGLIWLILRVFLLAMPLGGVIGLF